jgi:membrane fusion protein, multidrug efflux system
MDPAGSPGGPRVVGRLATALASFALLTLVAACGGEKAAAAPGGAAKGGPTGPGGPGGPRPPLVLAATDVGEVRRGEIEAGLPISGDLRPIQTVAVRARLEGDLVGVYVRPGERVNRGQLLARFEASEEESARAAAEADRVSARGEVNTAQWNYDQAQELFRAGAIPEIQVRTAEQTLTVARARLAAAESRVRATSSGLGDTRVLAPINGIVESSQVQGDERVSRGAELFTIVRGDVLELAASLPERLATGVRAGQRVSFLANGRPFDGKVARVSPTVDPATRAVTVFVEVPNPTGTLKGNTFITGRVVGRTIPDALLVPTAALRQANEGATPQSPQDASDVVYRIAGDVVERAPVSLGVVDHAAGLAEVVDGLREGDRVVVGNVGSVGRGVRVQILGGEPQGRGSASPANGAAVAPAAPAPPRQ